MRLFNFCPGKRFPTCNSSPDGLKWFAIATTWLTAVLNDFVERLSSWLFLLVFSVPAPTRTVLDDCVAAMELTFKSDAGTIPKSHS